MKKLALLGATGSIGRSTLEVVRSRPGAFSVESVSGNNNWKSLARIAREFCPRLVAIGEAKHAPPLAKALSGLSCRVLAGPEGVVEAAAASGAEMLVSAAVGAAGLEPTLAAIESGLDIALANKETLVMAGALVMGKVRERGVKLLPIDSEHSAIRQCLQCGRREEISRLVLTASGGPFRGMGRDELSRVTAREALAHPTWAMGPKISIDSATLANKALEIIEAYWLFDVAYDRIDVVVHPQAVVHSFVEFADGSCMAQFAPVDMKIPIQYALSGGRHWPCPSERIDLAAMGPLTFEKPDVETFPALGFGRRAGVLGGAAPAVFSAANEAAVELFLRDAIRFLDIPDLIEAALEAHTPIQEPDLAAIRDSDRWAREFVRARSKTRTGARA
ncbi:MAG: 1-deoxy-D-xylulose-5-phosphate reductoisomerase [Planctomycetota bacterium]